MLPELLRRRSRHVISEAARVHSAVEMLRATWLRDVGQLLNESHASLRDDYEVSCNDLNELTDLCIGFKGVFGSRLTGAGFGGCTVTLVEPGRVEALIEFLKAEYYGRRGLEPLAFTTRPAQGAEVLDL